MFPGNLVASLLVFGSISGQFTRPSGHLRVSLCPQVIEWSVYPLIGYLVVRLLVLRSFSDKSTSRLNTNLQDRESHLSGPGTHDIVDRFAASFTQCLPKVLCEGVVIRMALQINVHSLTEILELPQHTIP